MRKKLVNKTENNHFVTRALTTPWEGKDRYLWYYDFEKDKIIRNSSRFLFSEKHLLNDHDEKLFKRLIEDPLLLLKKEIIQNPTINTFEFTILRASVLYFAAQTLRYGKFLGDDSISSLSEFLNRDEGYLNGLTTAYQEKYDLVGIPLTDDQQYLFPQTGYFLFYIVDDTQEHGFTSGFAVPILPQFSIAMKPKNLTTEKLQSQIKAMATYSVGLNNNCKRVVFPATWREHNSDDDIIKYMKEKREAAQNLVRLFQKMKQLIEIMFKY